MRILTLLQSYNFRSYGLAVLRSYGLTLLRSYGLTLLKLRHFIQCIPHYPFPILFHVTAAASPCFIAAFSYFMRGGHITDIPVGHSDGEIFAGIDLLFQCKSRFCKKLSSQRAKGNTA